MAASATSSKVVLVTGATDGLGRAVAQALASDGWTVLAHGRNPAKTHELADELRRAGAPDARTYLADFASLEEVRAMAEAVLAYEPRLDVLVNNAGILLDDRQESRDRHELTFQVNYLAAYLLTRRLLPLLERTATASGEPARIVNVASAGQAPADFEDLMMERAWDSRRAYGQSKLAMISMAVELAPELEPRGITINALHPATFMPTGMVAGRFPPMHSIEDGARNTLRLIRDPALAGVTGRYFNQSDEARAQDQAYDAQARARLRRVSDELCGVPAS